MPAIPVYQQRTFADGTIDVGRIDVGTRGDGLEAVGNALLSVADNVQRQRESQAAARASEELGAARVRWAETETRLRSEAGESVDGFTPKLIEELRKDRGKVLSGKWTPTARDFLAGRFDAMLASYGERSIDWEATTGRAVRKTQTERGILSAAAAVERDPNQREQSIAEQFAAIDAQMLEPDERASLRSLTLDRINLAAESGRARENPRAFLERLKGADKWLDMLTPEARDRLQVAAEDALEGGEAERILSTYRENFRDGDRALSALAQSDLPPERLDGIRRRVREGVNLIRSERESQYMDRMTKLEQRIATGANVGAVHDELDALYRRGVYTPAQYSTLSERAAVNAVRSAEVDATRRELSDAIASGLPLDPSNRDHRAFLESAFAADAAGRAPGSSEWQALALGYAGRVRMLPPQAGAWLRSAARSPDKAVAIAAAQFWGGLEQQSPEAAGGVDTDTRAFLAQLDDMLAAGASEQTAFETARANVYETRRDVVDARDKAYRDHAKTTDGALASFIDRDFDTAFTREPSASAALRSDFDRQAGTYFRKVGDIDLARDLAWRDLKRIYGETRVNGEPVVAAFPVERFGVTADEARQDVAAFLGATKSAHKPEDVLIVPDAITLRSVSDAMTGKAVSPTYRLVTKDGDLVLGADGVPVRYALPSGDELAGRVRKSQEQARVEAEKAVEEARRRRERIEAAERARLELMADPSWGTR